MKFPRILAALIFAGQMTSFAAATDSEIFIPPADAVIAYHTHQTVKTDADFTVETNYKTVTACTIDGFNYIRLRELGKILDFEVGYDVTQDAVTLSSDKPYDASAAPLPTYIEQLVYATPTTQKILLDGTTIPLTGYMIDGYNYFKLRDVAQAMDFSVIYNGVENIIELDRDAPYFEQQDNTIILMYHAFCETEQEAMIDPTLYTTLDRFRENIAELQAMGFESISLEQYYNGETDPNKKYFIITIDDGYLNNYELAYPVLKELNVHADIFCVVQDLSGGRDSHFSYEQAREMEQSGVVSIHSHNLQHERATLFDDSTLTSMLNTAIRSLKQELGRDTFFFAYPYGDHNATTYLIAKRAGYKFQLVQARQFEADDILVRMDMYYTTDIPTLVQTAVYN